MSVYDEFEKATAGVSAVLILKDGNLEGRIVIRYRPTTVEVFLQRYDSAMVRGKAHRKSWGDAVEHALKEAVQSSEVDLNLPLGPLDGSGAWQAHLYREGYAVVWAC